MTSFTTYTNFVKKSKYERILREKVVF
uniref:Uncharacterized protein n=1 Tax=Anguilla anguilla TaxID=7936 RepID=A0A0E9UVI5_ANGAN